MRPEILFPLFSDVNRLTGVGPSIKQHLARLLRAQDPLSVPQRDLAFHMPLSLFDRRNSPPLNMAKAGDIVTLVVTVEAHEPSDPRRGRKSPYKIICHTPQGYLTLIYFHVRGDYLSKQLPVGQQKVVSGTLERYGAVPQITHPDIVAPVGELQDVMKVEPVYGLTAGLSNRQLGKIIHQALGKLPELPEWADAALLAREGWPRWKEAVLKAHAPQQLDDLLPQNAARSRLAYDELFSNQLALMILRGKLRKRAGVALQGSGVLKQKLLARLPFSLTQGQTDAVRQIEDDLKSGERMLRLLQGDVGSGKTAVALLAMAGAIEAGKQAAFMAPTEILARQHAAFLTKTAEAEGIRVVLLTGSLKSKEQEAALAQVKSGEAQMVIGTHALFQDRVQFKNLGLAVIDEQHRFGVRQRTALIEKSPDTHLLVMTATPIPRTLVMATYGDMDVSLLTEKPAGRKPIATKAIPLSRVEDVLEGIGRALQKGEKVYWVCPLIEEADEESQLPDLAAAQARFVEFTHRFGRRVALIHGRMKQAERDTAMLGFKGDAYDLLVATTVVEVGVDVPEATIMVIEHAERFGLSQMHQLRGRVGRSDQPSNCILLYSDNCGEIAKSRLRVMRETNDGFRIAEEDCRLRGSGDILGTRQSGLPGFHLAVMPEHEELMQIAHSDARLLLHQDPKLSTERGQAARTLLYLFSHDENVRLLEGG